ncbi:MAG: pyridoxamine 5'-phosphate oxidase family protein [Candidatus Hodarchaeota archaeon]
MRVKCEIHDRICILPDYISKFFHKMSFMHISTINSSGEPRICPTIFVNEPEKCILSFLINKKAKILEDLENNPFIALTIDETDPTNPFVGTGIMIEAKTQHSTSKSEINQCLENLQKKYNLDVVTKILGIDVIDKYIKFRALPIKLVFWKGPFFRKITCKGKKEAYRRFLKNKT